MVKRLVAVLALLLSVPAVAGYSVAMTAYSSPSGYYSMKPATGCYQTVSMAIGALPYANGTTIDMIDTSTNRWHAYYSSSSANWMEGNIIACTATALTGGSAYLAGGVSDPGIVAGGVAGESGGGTEAPFDYVKASAIFSFFFSFVVGVWLFCKNIGMVLAAVRRW